MATASSGFTPCLLLSFARAAFRRRQFHACASCFGQTDGDGLFSRARTVFSLADVLHFFADKFARLGRRRFSLSLVFASPFECLLFWHSTKNYAAKMAIGCGGLSFAENSTFSLDANVASVGICRVFTDGLERARSKPKSQRRIERHPVADCDANRIFRADTERSQEVATSGLEQRLRISPGRPFGRQHRAAINRITAGRESG